jgi:hypothetical protein
MANDGEIGRGNINFTVDAKMAMHATVRFGGEASYHRR